MIKKDVYVCRGILLSDAATRHWVHGVLHWTEIMPKLLEKIKVCRTYNKRFCSVPGLITWTSVNVTLTSNILLLVFFLLNLSN